MEKKICIKCNKIINPKKDDWYKTTLYFKQEIDSEIFFHRQCYKDFHKDKFKEEYEKRLGKFKPILNNLFRGIKNATT